MNIGIDGDGDEPESFAGTTTAEPYQRLRLSSPVDPRENSPGHTVGGSLDLFIVPYNSGMAIDCKGIVECWVEDWSIHNNNRGGGAIGDEARLWVGNNGDSGGVYISAHSEEADDPRKRWCRIVSRNFGGNQGNGPMQFIVRDRLDYFSFMSGDTGTRPGEVGNPTEAARITSGGSLRLGHGGAPLDRLHVSGSGGVAFRLHDSAVSGGAIRFTQVKEVLSLHTYGAGGAFTATPLKISPSGVGFNNAAPSRPALGAAATNAATTQALVNQIRAALISMGQMR